jgi:hypothetical protein
MSLCRRSTNILTATGSLMNIISEPVPGDSYYGFSDGLHTLQVTYDKFVGRFRIQVTLSLTPTESDWIEILPEFTSGSAWNPQGYVQFNSDAPGNGSEAYSIRGNFAYIRVYVDRRHMADGVTYDLGYGQVARVILCS